MLNHLWIIMDWNRRWAKERGLPSVFGHKSWADNVEKIVELAEEKGIKYITLWGLSSDNLVKRDEKEVKDLIKIIEKAPIYFKKMMKKGVKIDVIWDVARLPDQTQKILNKLIDDTKENDGIMVVLALVYGWKDEIIRGIKKFISEWWNVDELDEISFENYLDTWKYPPADVIVRTGWDVRHSGFLLYSSTYSEYYFTEKKWPDFDEAELDKVCDFFNSTKRNFGK